MTQQSSEIDMINVIFNIKNASLKMLGLSISIFYYQINLAVDICFKTTLIE